MQCHLIGTRLFSNCLRLKNAGLHVHMTKLFFSLQSRNRHCCRLCIHLFPVQAPHGWRPLRARLCWRPPDPRGRWSMHSRGRAQLCAP